MSNVAPRSARCRSDTVADEQFSDEAIDDLRRGMNAEVIAAANEKPPSLLPSQERSTPVLPS